LRFVARDPEYVAEHIKTRRNLLGAGRRQATLNETAIGS
jgi:hypothetical protein